MEASGSPFVHLRSRSHPLRQSLSEFMHARRLPPFPVPARLIQFVLLADDTTMRESVNSIQTILGNADITHDDSFRFHIAKLGTLDFCWERHSEFITYTFTTSLGGGDIFDSSVFLDAHDLIANAPGSIIRASRVMLSAQAKRTCHHFVMILISYCHNSAARPQHIRFMVN